MKNIESKRISNALYKGIYMIFRTASMLSSSFSKNKSLVDRLNWKVAFVAIYIPFYFSAELRFHSFP